MIDFFSEVAAFFLDALATASTLTAATLITLVLAVIVLTVVLLRVGLQDRKSVV